jgi:hypothetical protein
VTLNRRSTLILALSFALLGLLPQALSRIISDTAFPLWAADRMQHGARLYVDILEINPPLFIWLDLPLVWLSRLTGLSPITWYRIATSVVLFASLAGCWWVLRQGLEDEPPAYRRLLWLVAAFALLLLPRLDWGEREHLSLALTLPYILLGIARARGKPVGRTKAVFIGLAAGAGIALKPHFVLVWFGRELGVWWAARLEIRESHVTHRNGIFDARRIFPETVAAPILCITYLLTVIIIHPEYFHLIKQLGWAYNQFLRNPLWITLLLGDGSAVILGTLVIALALRILPHHAAVWRVLACTMIGFFLAAVIQTKEWRYHFYPALGLAMLLLGAMAWDARGPANRWTLRLLQVLPTSALVTAVVVAAVLAVVQTTDPLNPRYESDPSISALIPEVRARSSGRTLFAISPNMASGFPLTNYAGSLWSQRLPHIWPAVVAYDSAMRAPPPLKLRPLDQASPMEQLAVRLTVQDFVAARPPLVISLIPVDEVGWQMQRLDMVAFLQRDSTFAKAWKDYDLLGRVGNYVVWARNGDTLANMPLPPWRPAEHEDRALPGAVHVSPIGLPVAAFLVILTWLLLRRRALTLSG